MAAKEGFCEESWGSCSCVLLGRSEPAQLRSQQEAMARLDPALEREHQSVFIGTAGFCLLSLLSPDSALLDGSEKLNVPLARANFVLRFTVRRATQTRAPAKPLTSESPAGPR
jgi:hypothetical protein